MAKAGFKLNRKTVSKILHSHDGGKRAAAEAVLANLPAEVRDEAFIVEYHTDREVVGVVVPADKQAKDGVGTRAAGQAGLSQGRP